jgi:UDP-N-acetylmuramoyl-tripeptide--D-alanyl-D-alanine ligase
MWPLSAAQIYKILTDTDCPNKQFESIKIEGVATDSRKINPSNMFIAIKGDKLDGHSYLKECLEKNIPLALAQKQSVFLNDLSEEQKSKCILVEDVTASFRKLAKYFRSQFSFPVIAIGGSNGKTTTKEILYSMLLGDHNKVTKTEKSENGFLGMAVTLTQKAHNTSNPPNALVLEIGIDDIGAMSQHTELAQADIALLTALGPEHLEGLKTWEIAAKEELILFSLKKTKRIWQLCDEKISEHFFALLKTDPESLKKDVIVIQMDPAVKPRDDTDAELSSRSAELSSRSAELSSRGAELSSRGLTAGSSVEKIITWKIIASTPQETTIEIENQIYTIPLPGNHNAANFALAFATAIANKQTLDDIRKGFEKFRPPAMRSKITTFPNGTILYDDSYNASPMSMTSALVSLENKDWKARPKIVVLGDMLDLGTESKHWHVELTHALKKLKHTHLCLYGPAMYDCYKLLKENEDRLLTENQTCVFWRDAFEHPGLFFDQLPADLSNYIILVKGSRGMQLERFVLAAEEKFRNR